MPYDVVAYEADDLAMQLSEAEEGLFHRMLRRSWMNGSIPSDLKELRHICRTSYNRLKKAWVKIAPLWRPHPELPGRLINLKQESERDWVVRKQSAARASAVEGWKQRKLKEDANANAMQSQCERNASPPLPSPSPIEEKSIKQISPRVDQAFEVFKLLFEQERRPAMYQETKADFVVLAKLRKKLGVDVRGSPPQWSSAVENYLATPQGKYTLADLATRFDVFVQSPLDRYGKPVGGRYEPESREQAKVRRNIEASGLLHPSLYDEVGSGLGSGGNGAAGGHLREGTVGPRGISNKTGIPDSPT